MTSPHLPRPQSLAHQTSRRLLRRSTAREGVLVFRRDASIEPRGGGIAPLDQAKGDLRYNLIHFHPGPFPKGIIGYAPAFTNPRTGEILKADLHFYEGALRQVVFRHRLRKQSNPIPRNTPTGPLETPELDRLIRLGILVPNVDLIGTVRKQHQVLATQLQKRTIRG